MASAAFSTRSEAASFAHITISSTKVLAGFLAAAGVSLLLGIAVGLSQRVDDYVRPLFTAIAQVPVIGWTLC